MNAEWIWYRNDYELMLANQCLTKRYERDVFVPPFWRMDYFHTNVKFIRQFSLKKEERIFIKANGKFNIIIDKIENPENKYVRDFNGFLNLSEGNYKLTVSVYNEQTIPCLFVDGETVKSNSDFTVTCNDFEYVKADRGGFYDKDKPPVKFDFLLENTEPVKKTYNDNELHLDFGRESVAFIAFSGVKGSGKANIYYGETEEESRDKENCELIDTVDLSNDCMTAIAKAYRYVTIDFSGGVTAEKVFSVKEYVAQKRQPYFKCENEKINRIYETSLYTLDINTRDFLLDGVKRDRWIWGGDATQSYLMHYYSFFDTGVIERTMLALPNRNPQKTFINHIMDYSFYWIISLYDYYMYVGDRDFLERLYPIAESILEFTKTRIDKNGLLQGKPCDWVFIDWANLDNRGEVCAEQMIFLKALESMTAVGKSLGKDISEYKSEYEKLKVLIDETFWDKDKKCYIHSVFSGKKSEVIKKHPNIFAVYYGLSDIEKSEHIKNSVLENSQIEPNVTPYMRFYELSALAELGETDYVIKQIISYWGGMLDSGATTFWELYDEKEKGSDKYAMYGRKYGKSLCHAWGASPLFLLGRYFIGLKPASEGYGTFECKPCESAFIGSYEAVIPMKNGEFRISFGGNELKLRSTETDGIVKLDSRKYKIDFPICENYYIIEIMRGKDYAIKLERK